MQYYVDRENYDNIHPAGRPCRTTLRGDRYLVHSAEANTSQLLTQLCLDTNLDISEQTIRRRPRENGIAKHKAVKQPFLMAQHIAACLKWAREHSNWTIKQWQSMIWSDETNVRNQNDPRPQLVFRHCNKCEKYDPKNIQPKSGYGGASQIVWRCFIVDKLSPIVFMDSSVTKDVYISMLSGNLLPFIDILHADS